MAWLATALKSVGTALGAVLPYLKQRYAERSASRAPEKVAPSISDDVLDAALLRLGALNPEDPLWKRYFAGLDGALVRPDVFALPSVREWVSRSQVRAGLKVAVEKKIARSALPQQVIDDLADEYADATGEDRRLADRTIHVAIAVLQASVQGSVRDPGTAAIVQTTTAELGRKIDTRAAELEEAIGLSKNQHVVERFTQEGRSDLERILRRRATQGQQTAVDLRKLISDFEPGGRLAAAAVSVQADAAYWLARVEAAAGDVTAANQLDTLAKRGYPVSSSAWALVDLARGDFSKALQRVRDLTDPDSRTAVFHIVLKAQGRSAALQYVDDLGGTASDTFTAVGWNNICANLFVEGRVTDASARLAQLPQDILSECTSLYHMYAVSQLLPMLPADKHSGLVSLGFLAVSEHILDSPASQVARSRALEATNLALQCAIDAQDDLIAEQCVNGIRCLRLLDKATRDQEVASIAETMKDGKAAVRLIGLARACNIEVDTQPLENYLNHAQQLGGLSEQQLRAKLCLLNIPARNDDLVRFLGEEWVNLLPSNDAEMLICIKVQALAHAQDIDGATAFLDAHIDGVSEPVSSRLKLMLRDARGEDPTDAAAELFRQSNAVEDLYNLVRVLEGRGRWQRLAPYAEQLFNREPNFDNAMLRHKCLRQIRANAKEICSFLDGTIDQVEQRPEIRSARAWSHFEVGNHLEAKRLNDELLFQRGDVNDVALDVNIAIRTGDWERFPSIAARALGGHAQLTGQMLLTLAQLVGFSDPTQALSLAEEAVAREGDDPAVLVGANVIALAARRDDLAMPWVHKAAELSKQGGPVSVFSYREVVEFMRSSAESWKKKNELYRTAQIPLHAAAGFFNVPFSQLLIAVPRQNAKTADPRQRQPVPIQSGSRVSAVSHDFSRVALDITSLFILSELGRLGEVLDLFDEVFVSPRLMDVLLDDRRKVSFHQPSRIAEVKPLSAWVASGRLKVIDAKAEVALMAEVGDEAAVLLKEAEIKGGMYIHPGPLFKVSSYMEEEAALGALQARLADPIDVVSALFNEGVLTQVECDKGVAVLQRIGTAERQAVAPMTPLYLDGLAVRYLQQANILQSLLNAGHTVSVYKSTVDEWQALLATEPMAEEITKSIDALRRTVRAGLLSEKVKFLNQSRKQRDGLSAMTLLPLVDLLEDVTQIEAAVLDDRMLGGGSTFSDSTGRSIPLMSSLDLLNMLVRKGKLSDISRRELFHLLRSRCFFCIPILLGDLGFYLDQATIENGRLKETAELRTIRQYLARLNSTDVLCTPPDLMYQDSLWRVGSLAIRKLWMDPAISIADASAKSDWIAASILPDPELAMRFAPNGETQVTEVVAMQMSTFMMHVGADHVRQSAYALWLENSQLLALLPGNASVLDLAVDRTARLLVQGTSEIAIELRSRNHSDPVE